MTPQRDNGLIEEVLFKRYLRTQGLSYTDQRQHIIKEILKISKSIKHFSINRLYNHLHTEKDSISKSTLYRTIKLLEDIRIVKKTDIDKDHYVYEKVEQYNIGHMVCLNCKKIIEINNKVIKKMINQNCKKNSFKYNTHVFEIKGLCHSCIELSQ